MGRPSVGPRSILYRVRVGLWSACSPRGRATCDSGSIVRYRICVVPLSTERKSTLGSPSVETRPTLVDGVLRHGQPCVDPWSAKSVCQVCPLAAQMLPRVLGWCAIYGPRVRPPWPSDNRALSSPSICPRAASLGSMKVGHKLTSLTQLTCHVRVTCKEKRYPESLEHAYKALIDFIAITDG